MHAPSCLGHAMKPLTPSNVAAQSQACSLPGANSVFTLCALICHAQAGHLMTSARSCAFTEALGVQVLPRACMM